MTRLALSLTRARENVAYLACLLVTHRLTVFFLSFVVNAADNKQRDAKMDCIKVNIDA